MLLEDFARYQAFVAQGQALLDTQASLAKVKDSIASGANPEKMTENVIANFGFGLNGAGDKKVFDSLYSRLGTMLGRHVVAYVDEAASLAQAEFAALTFA